MAHETDIIRDWLFNTLSEDETIQDNAPGGVWHDLAGQEAPMPYIICSIHSGGRSNNTAGAEVFSDPLILVKTVSVTGEQDEQARAARDRITELLQEARVTGDGWRLRVKKAGFMPEYTEVADGARYYAHRGRFWRFYVSTGQGRS